MAPDRDFVQQLRNHLYYAGRLQEALLAQLRIEKLNFPGRKRHFKRARLYL
jgi:hypothetical protein